MRTPDYYIDVYVDLGSGLVMQDLFCTVTPMPGFKTIAIFKVYLK